jgi:hypothetical protein
VDDVGVVWDLQLDGIHRHPECLALGVLADLLNYLDDFLLRALTDDVMFDQSAQQGRQHTQCRQQRTWTPVQSYVQSDTHTQAGRATAAAAA